MRDKSLSPSLVFGVRRDVDVDAGVFGGDERLEGAEVARDGVELVGGHGRRDGGWMLLE